MRRKINSKCYNSADRERKRFMKNCICGEEDYECDMGYFRTSAGPCEPINNFGSKFIIPQKHEIQEMCKKNIYYNISSGYRKIIGDTCENGVQHRDIQLLCPSVSIWTQNGSVIFIVFSSCLILLVLLICFTPKQQDKNSKLNRRNQDLQFSSFGEAVQKLKQYWQAQKLVQYERAQPEDSDSETEQNNYLREIIENIEENYDNEGSLYKKPVQIKHLTNNL